MPSFLMSNMAREKERMSANPNTGSIYYYCVFIRIAHVGLSLISSPEWRA